MTTDSFNSWKLEKKIKDSDLIFTRALKSIYHQDLFNRLATALADQRPSFSEGLQMLELFTDLLLMDYSEALFLKTDDLETWKCYLQNLRYPMTTYHDEAMKNKFQNLPWPNGAKTKFERRGDRAGVEFKFFISSEADLTKLIASLERVKAELK